MFVNVFHLIHLRKQHLILILVGLLTLGPLQPLRPRTAAASAAQPSLIWPQISLSKLAGGFESPVHVTHAGDNSGRIFVVEQPGRIRIINGNTVKAKPFLDITHRVLYGGEQGLLCVAFPPQFSTKGYFYVYFTNLNGNNEVDRFHLTTDPDVADPGSAELILLLQHPKYINHNGGQLAFGPDGYLYIGTGDGGGGGDPNGNAQNTGSLLGKLLRIGVEPVPVRAPGPHSLFLPIALTNSNGKPVNSPYFIPSDNPFVGVAGKRGEIWALGLRNPWRFSFDRQTRDLYIADVGQGDYEEIDFQPAASEGGENYGWNIMEGNHCYNSASCNKNGLVLPVTEYGHPPDNCSVTGGMVYRGGFYPGLAGIYFYGDYCSGRIWGLQYQNSQWQSALLLDTNYSITSFGEDQAGELYLADQGSGSIYSIENP